MRSLPEVSTPAGDSWTAAAKSFLFSYFHFHILKLKKIVFFCSTLSLAFFNPTPLLSHQPISSTYGGGEELIWQLVAGQREPKSPTKPTPHLTFFQRTEPFSFSIIFDTTEISSSSNYCFSFFCPLIKAISGQRKQGR